MGKGKLTSRLKFDEEIKSLISATVEKAFSAGQTAQQPANAYKAAEKKLYSLPVLVRRQDDLEEKLQQLKTEGSPERSRDIKRLCRPGTRLDPEEVIQTLILGVEADLAACGHEIEVIKGGLRTIESDEYYSVISGRYFDKLPDAEIAKLVPCSERTVRRHRTRLVQSLSVWWYPASCI